MAVWSSSELTMVLFIGSYRFGLVDAKNENGKRKEEEEREERKSFANYLLHSK